MTDTTPEETPKDCRNCEYSSEIDMSKDRFGGMTTRFKCTCERLPGWVALQTDCHDHPEYGEEG